jgi:hypothetical protein
MLSIDRKGVEKVADEGAYERMKRISEESTGGRMSEIGGPDRRKGGLDGV